MSIDARRLPQPTERHLRVGRRLLHTLILWALLVVVFAVTFFVQTRGWVGALSGPLVALLAPWVVGGAVAIAFVVPFVRALRWQKAHNRAAAQLTAGELEAAAAGLELVARKAPQPIHQALTLGLLASCELQLGRPERALSLYATVEASGALRRVSLWHNALPSSIAACLALQGDVTQARAWLEETERRRKGEPVISSLLPAVVVLLREGHAGAAARTLEERWREAESAGGAMTKALRVLRGFALHQQDAQAHAAEVASWVAGVHPLRPGELDFLCLRWPQLRDFLQAEGLTARAAA